MSLTVTATPDNGTGSVRLLIDGGTPPYVVDASPGGDRPDYRIRSVYANVAGQPAARAAVDGDLPLNTPTVYVATDATGAQALTPAVQVDSDVTLLSDATDPGRVVPVTVVSQKPNGWEARSVWWDVLGQREPFVSVAPLRLRSGPLVLRADTRRQRAALINLLSPGNPLVLRSPCPDAVDDLVLLATSVDESLVLEALPAGPSHFTLDYQAVSRDLGPYAVDPSRSYAAVKAAWGTYGDVLAAYPSYDALRAGDALAGLGPEMIVDGAFDAGLSGTWSVFYTTPGISWDTSDHTARATMAGSAGTPTGSAFLNPGASSDTTPGRRYRVTGKVRSSNPATQVAVYLLTNTKPDTADWFSPGVAVQTVALKPAAAWSSFVADFTVPIGDDDVTLYFRADNLTDGAIVEWDDLSMRERV